MSATQYSAFATPYTRASTTRSSRPSMITCAKLAQKRKANDNEREGCIEVSVDIRVKMYRHALPLEALVFPDCIASVVATALFGYRHRSCCNTKSTVDGPLEVIDQHKGIQPGILSDTPPASSHRDQHHNNTTYRYNPFHVGTL